MAFDPFFNQPSEAVLYTTSKCNGRCSFCLRQLEGYKPVPDITVEVVEKVLDAFPRIASACVAGFGEPLMLDELPELLRFLDRRNVYSGVITNGLDLDDLFDEIPWESTGHVTVSLNAADGVEHFEAFGVQAWEDVQAGIIGLQSIGKPVILSFVISRKNFRKMEDYLFTARDLGVNAVVFVNTLPHGNLHDPGYLERFRSEVILSTDRDALEEIERCRAEARRMGVNVGVWPVPVDLERCPKLCRSPFTRIGVDGNGDITGCIRIIPPAPGQGNISEGPLVWAMSKHLEELRAGLDGSGEMRVECSCCFGNWIEG